MNDQKLNVFYFSSDLFASVMSTSIVSLLENNKSFQEIDIYIIDDGLSDEKKALINQMIDNYSGIGSIRKVKYIPAPSPQELFDYPFKTRYQMGHSYVRMAVGSLLPQDVHKVLCLDSDTLVLGNLSKLWSRDLDNNIMAGVSDCMNVHKYRERFWIDNPYIYCNAGVFLIDLDKWRDERTEDYIKERIKKQNGNVFFFEQTLMNWCCKGRILRLEPEYNAYTLMWAFDYKNLMKWRNPTGYYNSSDIERAKKNPIIIHYTRNFYMMSRPWIKNCDHTMTKVYREYMKLTPWPSLLPDKRDNKEIRKYRMWHKIPQELLVTGARFLYNDIRPKLWWKNE